MRRGSKAKYSQRARSKRSASHAARGTRRRSAATKARRSKSLASHSRKPARRSTARRSPGCGLCVLSVDYHLTIWTYGDLATAVTMGRVSVVYMNYDVSSPGVPNIACIPKMCTVFAKSPRVTTPGMTFEYGD